MVGKNKDNIAKMPADQILNVIVVEAIKRKSSFIHIEPASNQVYVRYRVNGSLIDFAQLPKKRFDSLIDKLKSSANMNPKERSTPQEGRFKFKVEDETYTLRTSILPTIEGEKVAISITSDSPTAPSLNQLGYWGSNLETLSQVLGYNSGLVLIIGPHDSGKSTTLFSMLSAIKDPDIKIATIEDPVEFKIPGANQIQVNQKLKLSFSGALNSLLRHDTNVIMISELRSLLLIKMSFNVASRGKLILSSAYGNNPVETIHQFINIGVSPAEIAHSLRTIVSQKLARKLCPGCRISYEPDSRTMGLIDRIYGTDKPPVISQIHDLEIKYASESRDQSKVSAKDLSTTESRIKRFWKASDKGCEKCSYSGFMGRLSINEVFINTPSIQKLISTLASRKIIIEEAKKQGMIPLAIDCLVKALQGETSIEDVFKLNLEFL